MSNSTVRVYYQGEHGAFSEMAGMYFFKEPVCSIGKSDFESVVSALNSEENCFGVLPIENSLTGSIHSNYDLLLKYNHWIIGEVVLRITYNLFAIDDNATIREVWSHPVALEQCRRFLSKNPEYRVLSFFDSAGAAKIVKNKNMVDVGIIAGPHVGELYGLKKIAEKIEDNPMNFTRFLILSREKKIYSGDDAKTSLVFGVKNEPGILFRCLSIFALRNIDLLKLESRPIIGKPWEYIFYIDFKGSVVEEKCAMAIETLDQVAVYFRLLGSYRVINEESNGFDSK